MKRSFFISAFFLFFTYLSQAQGIIVGPRAGINLSSLRGFDQNTVRPGWGIGAFAMYQFTERAALSCDILLSAKGARAKRSIISDSLRETWDSYINLNYLEIPLLFNIDLFKKSNSFRPRIFVGPSLALKLSATESFKYNKVQDNNDTSSFASYKTFSKYKSTDVGIAFGAGFSYNMAERTYFSFDARYVLGITDVRNNSNFYPSALYNYNFTFLIGIGYRICR